MIAERKAAGTSSETREYGPVEDKTVEFGRTYVYRLKMVDNDGKYAYSQEQEVEIGGNNWLGTARPNPASTNNVSFDCSYKGAVTVLLYDMNGKKTEPKYELTGKELKLDLNGLSNGTYTVLVKSGDKVMTRQFQVNR